MKWKGGACSEQRCASTSRRPHCKAFVILDLLFAPTMLARAMNSKENFRGLKIIRMFVFTLFPNALGSFHFAAIRNTCSESAEITVLENPADLLCNSSH